jgi:hypothetical protein
MYGWNEPLSDRLWKEVQTQDMQIDQLKAQVERLRDHSRAIGVAVHNMMKEGAFDSNALHAKVAEAIVDRTHKALDETPDQSLTAIHKPFIDLCDDVENTCLGNGGDDMVSVGGAQFWALMRHVEEMRGNDND